jgi:hypothetical protein
LTFASFAAYAGVATAALAIGALAVLHLLKPEVSPWRNMISQYALGRHGWVMALCFAAFAVASASVFAVLLEHEPSVLGRIGSVFLLIAAVGLALASRFPMDAVSTPRERMSISGKMHGVAFLLGVPAQTLAVLLLSIALGRSRPILTLLLLTATVWLSLVATITIMVMVGPGKQSDPKGPERFLGLPNRLFMVAYGAWLIVAAWPTVH